MSATSPDRVSPADGQLQSGESRFNWLGLLVVAALLLLAYAEAVRLLVRDWMIDDNVSHGFFVPLVAAYVAWQKRDALRRATLQPHWFGLVIVIGAALQYYVATLGAELFLARTALVFAIIGSVLFLAGFKVLRLLAFPLFLLFFMIPIPAIIFNQIALPLQFLASDLAEKSLALMGIPVLREGNILELPSQRLSVVEACSGIRSLLSLSFLALVYGFFFESRAWLRAVLFLATIPIAIVANAGRVTLTGLASEVNPELAQGVFHFVEGWVVFAVAIVLLVMTHRLLRLFVPAKAPASGGQGSSPGGPPG